jgi:hypothetical protein
VAAADKYSVDFVVNNYLAAGLKAQQMNQARPAGPSALEATKPSSDTWTNETIFLMFFSWVTF